MLNNKRNDIIDISKGIGIILVVVGHSGSLFHDFIYLFHMALFFMLAGYCHHKKNSENFEGVKGLIIRRLISLYKPYVLWNMFYLLMNNLFVYLNIYTANPLILNTTRQHWRVINDIGFIEMVKSSIKIFTFGELQQLAGASWFLAVLFTVTIMFTCVEYVLKNSNKRLVVQLLISVVFLMTGYFFYIKHISLPRYLCVSLSVYILFYFGRLFYFFEQKRMIISNKIRFCLICLSLIVLQYSSKEYSIEIGMNSYENPLILISMSGLGFVFVYNVAYFIDKSNLSKVFTYIGQCTLSILFLHFISFKLITLIQIKIYNEDSYRLAAFPTL